MNYFTKKRLVTWLVTALIIINITSLITIWMERHGVRPPRHKLPENTKEATTFFLKQELQFSDEQVQLFIDMQDDFMKKSEQIKIQIGDSKRELFGGMIDDRPIDKETLITRIGELSSQREDILYNYFLAVKNLCTDKQKKKFKMLMGEILLKIDPDHRPPGGKPGRRPNGPPGMQQGQRPDGPPTGEMPPKDRRPGQRLP